MYKAKKACPCACGTKDCNPCVDDQLWKADRTIDNCKWVSKKPEERCDVVSTYDGTKAKDFCRASCGTCGDAPGPAPGYKPTKKPSSGGAQYVPTYKPTRRPSGECEDDETWEYLAGDKGYKRCDHVAKKPDPRCGRVSDDGVVASEACPKTCGTCG